MGYDISLSSGFLKIPTFFWWIPLTDNNLKKVNQLGFSLSCLVILGIHNFYVFFILWFSYHTILGITHGSTWYSYGWESQIIENGFIGIFLCSFFGSTARSNLLNIWLYRWLIFRITIGAGLIKIRGSSCWIKRVALYYHFETQPIPSPFSSMFHYLSKSLLSRAIFLDYFVQIYTSIFVLFSGIGWFRYIRVLGGLIQLSFMFNIILSGNYSFLNYLTLIPCFACFDDQIFRFNKKTISLLSTHCWSFSFNISSLHDEFIVFFDFTIHLFILYIIFIYSRPVIENLLSNNQIMNTSFDNFRLVNTYGAFGSIGRNRFEVVISGSYDGKNWLEYEFKVKSTLLNHRLSFCSPYHYRIDWNIWFLCFPPYDIHGREKWIWSFVNKLLLGDEIILRILEYETNLCIYTKGIPKYIKCELFQYFIQPFSTIEDICWEKKFRKILIQPISRKNKLFIHNLKCYYEYFGFITETLNFPFNV